MSYQWPEDREDDYQKRQHRELEDDDDAFYDEYQSGDYYDTPGRGNSSPAVRLYLPGSKPKPSRDDDDDRDRPVARGRDIDDEDEDRAMSRDDRSDSRGRRMDRDESPNSPRRRKRDDSPDSPRRRTSPRRTPGNDREMDRSDSRGRNRDREDEEKYRDESPISVLDPLNDDDRDLYGDTQQTYGGDRDEAYTNRRTRTRTYSDASISSISSYDSRTGRHRRRLSQAEARFERRAREKAREEAERNMKEKKDAERRKRAVQNRNRVRQLEQRPNDSDEDVCTTDLKLGDVVYVNRAYGVVRYVGPIRDVDRDTWIGVEMVKPKGNSDGSVRGKFFFRCEARHGYFCKEVDKRISPEKLLMSLAAKNDAYKKEKDKADKLSRKHVQNDILHDQVAALTAENAALKKGNVRDIEKAMTKRMENFLGILTDGMKPDEEYETPGRAPSAMGIPQGNLPSSSNTASILTWLKDKKRQYGLRTSEPPQIMEYKVQEALIWLVKTLQREVRSNNDEYSDEGEE